MEKFDLIVIGAGPGGYVSAIKASQLGLKVACVEKNELGGTCLNVGCIPSKALLNNSYKYYDATRNFSNMGLNVGSIDVDVPKVIEYKNKIVKDLTTGIAGLFKKNKVTHLKGLGKIKANNQVEVNGSIYEADKILVATGSEPFSLPNIEIDEESIVSSTGALDLKQVPEKMLVIGAGVIGLEMGSVWSRFGSKVTVVEFADAIFPGLDKEISKNAKNIFDKQGLSFQLGHKVTSANKNSNGKVDVTIESVKDGSKINEEYDIVLVAIGRKPYTNNLGLEDVGVKTDERGRIIVNDKFESNIKGIYAIGDVIDGPMLAHKAEEDGIAAVSMMCNKYGHVDYNLVPGIIYTHPEIASVGKTEEQLKESGIEYKVGKFPFLANSRARANSDIEGLVKIITDKKTDQILGAHVIGSEAGDLIQLMVFALEYSASAEDLSRICYGHPTLSEAIKEACLAAYDKAIHI